MNVTPYLYFDGCCEEALAFYSERIGAEVETLMRFKENPDRQARMAPPGSDEKIMHASLRIGESTVLASDGRCQGKPNLQGFALTLLLKSEAEADKAFAALSDGGQVQMPLTKTFFSPRFGMLADRFGVAWIIITA